MRQLLGNLRKGVFERPRSTGSGLFTFLSSGFAKNVIVSSSVKKLSNTNFIASWHIKGEKSSLPVDVRHSKTPLLELPIGKCFALSLLTIPEVFGKVNSSHSPSRF